jgi:hypothetical protein
VNLFAGPADQPEVTEGRPVLKRFVLAFAAFVGLIVPATFALALLAAPPAHPEPAQRPGCDHTLANASASIVAMQGRIKSLSATTGPEICTAIRLYFLEVVKARAVTALSKSGPERERELGRFDADVEYINEAIAAHCS